MNDPHVVALHYRVEHRESVNYEKAVPLEHASEQYCIQIEDCRARFEMKEHYATAKEAREVVEPFVQAWEIDAGLRCGLREIEFVFERAEIVDRNPPPGVVLHVDSGHIAITGYAPTFEVGRSSYPEPPTNLAVNVDVGMMYDRYCQYREGKDTLAAMAYFCLTVLEATAEGRKRPAAAKLYQIDLDVLSTLGRLTAEKGGSEARKAEGAAEAFTERERGWIEGAVKAIIRRAAEVEYDPSTPRDQIVMAALPPLV